MGSSSFSTSGNNLTLTLALSFRTAFAGAKRTYMEVYDGLDSGWLQKGTWTVPASGGADYTITVTPSSRTVTAGGSTSYTVTLTSIGGFNTSVSLTASGWPSGAAGNFSPASLIPTAAGASSTLNVTTAGNTPGGTSTINIQASGSVNHSTSTSLTVSGAAPSFTVTVSGAQTMAPGDGTTYAVTVTSVNGFSGAVTLGASGLGSGATASFNPGSVTVPSNGKASSTLAVSTITSAQLGTFTVGVQGTGGSSTPGSTSLTLSTSSTPASQINAFIACVASPSSATYCALPTLPAGTYYSVLQTIAVGHSNVTVTGGGSAASQTVLVRAPNNTSPMMQVGISHVQPVTGVTIQNLTFCGSSTLPNSSPSPSCPSPTTTSCANANCVDLNIVNADSGQNPVNPFSYTGPYSLTISNTDFEDATGHAISMQPGAPDKVNDVYICCQTKINSSAITGIHVDGLNAGGTNYNDRKVCDANSNWANDTTIFLPRNIRIENTSFSNNNTGAIGMSARWVALRSNAFTRNYHNPQAGNSAGGSVFFNQCADTVLISGNTMSGPSPSEFDNTSGLELWGRNITVNGNNTFSGYPAEGIALNSVFNATIGTSGNGNAASNNDQDITWAPSGNYKTGGIAVWTRGPGAGCGQIPRDTQNVTITGNTSAGQAYGLYIGDGGVGRNTINGLTIGPNTFQSNSLFPIYRDAPIVVLNGLSGPPNPPGLTTGTKPNDPPRALSVDAVSPGTVRCPATGSGHTPERFTFAASDAVGAANIQDMEVMFSLAAPPAPPALPAPDDGKNGCHFMYVPYQYPPTPGTFINRVYLAGAQGGNGSLWTAGSSVVGAGGADLTNGICTIHAASSSATLTLDPYIVDLTLDIDFLNLPRSYMYVVTLNHQQQLVSNSGKWTYYGFWSIN